MNLILFYGPNACSLVPYVTLTEAGAEFEVRRVNMGAGQHMSPDFLKFNPKHKIPVLVIDGEPLTENVAIQIWIARNFPDARLLPRDSLDEYRAISFLAWCASGIHPTLTPNHKPEKFCDFPGSAESVRQCAQKIMLENFQIAEDKLNGQDWFFEEFTACDAYFFWCFRRASQFGIDLSQFRNCNAHFERMMARPSVQKLVSFEAQVVADFKKAAGKS